MSIVLYVLLILSLHMLFIGVIDNVMLLLLYVTLCYVLYEVTEIVLCLKMFIVLYAEALCFMMISNWISAYYILIFIVFYIIYILYLFSKSYRLTLPLIYELYFIDLGVGAILLSCFMIISEIVSREGGLQTFTANHTFIQSL